MLNWHLNIGEPDKPLAIIGVIVSLFLIIYLILFNGRFIWILTGFLSLCSCLVWIFLRTTASLEVNFDHTKTYLSGLTCSFFLLYIFSFIVLLSRSNLFERPLAYFILMAAILGVFFLQVLNSKETATYLLLFEIFLIGVNIVLSEVLLFPDLIGLDPHYHRDMSTSIVNSSHIPGNLGYSAMPLFHLIISTTMLFTGLNYKLAVISSINLAQIILLILFIFILGKLVFNNNKVGLLASAMVIIANQQIFMLYSAIPNSIAGAFIPMVMFLILLFKWDNLKIRTLLALVLILILLTHTITTLFACIILFLIWIISRGYSQFVEKDIIPISLTFSILYGVFVVGWWNFVSFHIITLIRLIRLGFDPSIFVRAPNEVIQNFLASIPLSEQIINNFGFFLFWALSFIGIFYMISKNGNLRSYILAGIGIFPLFLGYIVKLTGYTIIEQRWWFFAQILLSIPLAVSLILLTNYRNRWISITPIFLVSFLTFLMIINPVANIDNNALTPNVTFRTALIDSEIKALSFFSSVNDTGILTDEMYSIADIYTTNTSLFSREIYSKNLTTIANEIFLIREEVATKPFMLFTTSYKLDYSVYDLLSSNNFSCFYDIGAVRAFKRT